MSDVTVFQNQTLPYVSVIIKRSKTDKFNKGVTIYIGCTSDPDICAHCFLKVLVSQRTTGPLFMFSNGLPLSKSVFVKNTRLTLSLLGYDCTRYSGHSYRSGAATSASMAGMSDYDIKLLGRWSSQVYHRYIHTPVLHLASYSKRIYKP